MQEKSLVVRAVVLSAALLTGGVACAQGGLIVRNDSQVWPRWQGRLSLGTTTLNTSLAGLRSELLRSTGDPFSFDTSRSSALSQMSLMGDYYFRSASLDNGISGGLRATSGIMIGPRSSLLTSTALPNVSGTRFSLSRVVSGMVPAPGDSLSDVSTVPYLGVGYTGVALKGGLSFSADFGLAAMGAGSGMRLGRVLSGNQGLDDLVRDLQLRPVVQIGVSYSF